MIYHAGAVRRGCTRALVVVDLPFLSYQVSPEEAIRNAGRVLAETDCHAVKIEGGSVMAPTVEALVARGIPVVGHLGLTPQSINTLGGYRVQGRGDAAATTLVADAQALEAAGASAVVLELIPRGLAARVTAALRFPPSHWRRPGVRRQCSCSMTCSDSTRGSPRASCAAMPSCGGGEARRCRLRDRRARRRVSRREPLVRVTMRVVATVSELRQALAPARGDRAGLRCANDGRPARGHLRLVDEAHRHADVVVLSVFVNPLQFGPQKICRANPRPVERDRTLAEGRGGVAPLLAFRRGDDRADTEIRVTRR